MLEELREFLTVEGLIEMKSPRETTIPTGGAGRSSYKCVIGSIMFPVSKVDLFSTLSGGVERSKSHVTQVCCGETSQDSVNVSSPPKAEAVFVGWAKRQKTL
jgi:hypothetical protein